MSGRDITAVAGWFGSNRMKPERVGLELGELDWCGVPCVGGGPELPHINCRSGVANDLHRHVINLYRVLKSDELCAMAAEQLDRTLFHQDEFADAQERCRMREQDRTKPWRLTADFEPEPGKVYSHEQIDPADAVAWAVDYAIACWMGPGARAGKRDEFRAYFSSRWTATGGASVKRFRSWIESMYGWRDVLKRWEFRCMDAFDFIHACKDTAGHGLYVDFPWVKAGVDYRHPFNEAQHREGAELLGRFKECRVVVRYDVCPLIEELYPRGVWTWVETTTRNQQNGETREVLLINGSSRTQGIIE